MDKRLHISCISTAVFCLCCYVSWQQFKQRPAALAAPWEVHTVLNLSETEMAGSTLDGDWSYAHFCLRCPT